MSGKRPKYTPEFREQAARLVIESGRLWLDPQVTTRMPVSETEATFAMPQGSTGRCPGTFGTGCTAPMAS
jgi:hypothetical protein